VIDLEGGEAQRVTNVYTGARAPQWRPDGRAVLFVSDVYPGAASDQENRKAAEERRTRKWNARVYDTFPIRDWDRWLDDRRPSLFVQVLETGATARDLLARSQLVSARGFSGQAGSGSDTIAAAWTPDGSGDPAKKYPLFVVIHGGPHSMWIDQFVVRWNYHLLAKPGYVVLLTNYTGSTGFGEKFAQGIQGDPLEGPGLEVNEAADEAIKRFPYIDATRQAAGGASYGGHMANWLAVTTTRYKALVSHAGLFDQSQQWGTSDIVFSRERSAGGPPWENAAVWTKQNPLSRAGNLKTPMLVTVGERDYRVPMNNAIQLWSALQRMKVPGRLIVFPDENHWVLRGENSRFFYNEIHSWLAKWFGSTTSARMPNAECRSTPFRHSSFSIRH
jgi:dipeptidyl aminopeptidase/acylaminoacyl peptidase